jgi:hypothetical protein
MTLHASTDAVVADVAMAASPVPRTRPNRALGSTASTEEFTQAVLRH